VKVYIVIPDHGYEGSHIDRVYLRFEDAKRRTKELNEKKSRRYDFAYYEGWDVYEGAGQPAQVNSEEEEARRAGVMEC